MEWQLSFQTGYTRTQIELSDLLLICPVKQDPHALVFWKFAYREAVGFSHSCCWFPFGAFIPVALKERSHWVVLSVMHEKVKDGIEGKNTWALYQEIEIIFFTIMKKNQQKNQE